MTEEKQLKEKACKLSVKEGSFYSLMDGFGMRYITPFALALGAGNVFIGLLNSLPGFLGNFSQLFTVRMMENKSRKKIVYYGTLFQALLWLPIIAIGLLFFYQKINLSIALVSLIGFYTILVMFGSFISPAWNSWMRDLVPQNKLGEYHGNRNRIVGSVALISMLAAGIILDYFSGSNIFFGFSLIFLIAFLGRSISAYIFTKKYEPEIKYEKGYYFTFWGFFKKMPYNNFGRFVIFAGLMSFAVAIASPFFAVYVLKNLGLGYISYTVITISSAVSMLFFMPLWGKFSDKYGDMLTLKITGFLVAIVPLMWLFSPLINKEFLVPYLILSEVMSGILWAGFNLSSATFIVTAVTRQRMGLCVAYDNFVIAGGAFAGAMIGGLLASLDFPIIGLKPILFIFLLSAVARLAVAVVLIPALEEVEVVKKFDIRAVKEMLLTTPRSFWTARGIKRPGFNTT